MHKGCKCMSSGALAIIIYIYIKKASPFIRRKCCVCGRTLTYPGIPAVQDLIGGSPGGAAGYARIQPVANFSSAAAVKQQFSLPFLQPLGQASVVTSSSPGAHFSSLAKLCVPTFPHVDRDGQHKDKLQMLHSLKR